MLCIFAEALLALVLSFREAQQAERRFIWVMINVLHVAEKSDLLHQVFLTDKELKHILTGAQTAEEHQELPADSKNNTSSSGSPTPPSVFLTNVEMGSIFEAKQSSQPQQILTRKIPTPEKGC